MKTQLLKREIAKIANMAAITLLLGMGAMGGTAQAVERVDVMQIAKATDIPGKRVHGACREYAQELFNRMEQQGVKAWIVRFNWESYKFSDRQRSGAHVMVVFQDERGRFYGMDNEKVKPVWLKGNSPSEWANFFAGMDYGTGVYATVASSAARGDSNVMLASN